MDIFDGFVDNPKLYLTAMRCMFAFSTPLFILAIYVIMTASNSTSSSLYRWFPMYQVCLNFISDMIIGPGEAPVLYLPLMGGCPNGVLKLLGIPTVVAIGVAYVVYYCRRHPSSVVRWGFAARFAARELCKYTMANATSIGRVTRNDT
ncbi:unnamed protein product [Nippostrongylus brasiliensis]|uniref:RSN1_7TM domain-containing protein n=1 Tax=Nippostrongylus brasiliensis TaxID=27835 RepID=A0A0N4YCG3_NIPBR|nr:unnamed protein product [Nippostrongylus brasiliensis]